MRALLFTALLLASSIGSSQNFQIDELIKKIPAKSESSMEALVAFINENADSDLEKARGAYYWIANNIRYDAKKFFKDKPSYYKPEDVFRKRKGICGGYANLFREICNRLKIQCVIVTGYSKGYGYKQGQVLGISDHAWNAFKIDSTWYLTDVTWAGGYVQKGFLKKKFVAEFNDKYFALTSIELAADHLPEIPMWQLTEHPVPVKIFSGDEGKIYAFIKNASSEKYYYNDSIRHLLSIDPEQDGIQYGQMALRFNPLNTTPLAFAKLDLLYSKRDLLLTKGISTNPAIDSTITSTNDVLELLKNARPSKKSEKKVIEDAIAETHSNLSDLYFLRADNTLKHKIVLRIKDFDTLQYYTKPGLLFLERSFQANQKIINKKREKEILDELCTQYAMAYVSYSVALKNEEDKEKNKNIQKEFNILIQNAKKVISPKCNCFNEVQRWK